MAFLPEKEEQILLWRLKRITAATRVLIFPTFVLAAACFAYAGWSFQKEPFIYREMPVIVVYCNELDLKPGQRLEKLKNPDFVVSRCQERVVWAGEDRQGIRGLAQQKADEIVNSLFSNPEDPDMVRSSATETLRYFVRDSVPYTTYRDLAKRSIDIAEKDPTSFKVKGQYLRVVKDSETDQDHWVAKFDGIWIVGDKEQTGKRVTMHIVFAPVHLESRNQYEQAIMVKEFEVQIEK